MLQAHYQVVWMDGTSDEFRNPRAFSIIDGAFVADFGNKGKVYYPVVNVKQVIVSPEEAYITEVSRSQVVAAQVLVDIAEKNGETPDPAVVRIANAKDGVVR